jgi:hypothetical protein
MSDSILRAKIALLLWVSGRLEWLNDRTFLCIDSTSEELMRRRWEKVRDRTRR